MTGGFTDVQQALKDKHRSHRQKGAADDCDCDDDRRETMDWRSGLEGGR